MVIVIGFSKWGVSLIVVKIVVGLFVLLIIFNEVVFFGVNFIKIVINNIVKIFNCVVVLKIESCKLCNIGLKFVKVFIFIKMIGGRKLVLINM